MLAKCPECKNQVSDTAEACPYCGYRVKSFYSSMHRLEWRISSIQNFKPPVKKFNGEAFLGGLIACFIGVLMFGFSVGFSLFLIAVGIVCFVFAAAGTLTEMEEDEIANHKRELDNLSYYKKQLKEMQDKVR